MMMMLPDFSSTSEMMGRSLHNLYAKILRSLFWMGMDHFLNENREPITLIANDITSLHSIVFLIEFDEHGESKYDRIYEMIGCFVKHLKLMENELKFALDMFILCFLQVD